MVLMMVLVLLLIEGVDGFATDGFCRFFSFWLRWCIRIAPSIWSGSVRNGWYSTMVNLINWWDIFPDDSMDLLVHASFGNVLLFVLGF